MNTHQHAMERAGTPGHDAAKIRSPVCTSIGMCAGSSQLARPELSIIVPMYQEARRIEPTLIDIARTLHRSPRRAEVILVNDGSTDGTSEAVRGFLAGLAAASATHRMLVAWSLIEHPRNAGKGAAVRTGLAAARGDFVLSMDADNSTPLCELAKLEACLRDDANASRGAVGMVIGSRATPDADVDARIHRRLAGLCFRVALRVLGLELARDTQCGFKLYRSDLAQQIAQRAQENGYAYDIEHLLLTSGWGLRVLEVGVSWQHRAGGQIAVVRDGLKMMRAARRIKLRLNANHPAWTHQPCSEVLRDRTASPLGLMVEIKPAPDDEPYGLEATGVGTAGVPS